MPATVAAYLAHLADTGLKASTIARRLAAIAYAHKLKGLESPTAAEAVHVVMRGIRRKIGTAPAGKAPATAKAVAAMLEHLPDTLIGRPDRAILLIGFAAALRRSELVALDVGDIENRPEGIIVHIRQSKTDQEGLGAEIPVPRGGQLKPVEALDAWLAAAGSALSISRATSRVPRRRIFSRRSCAITCRGRLRARKVAAAPDAR